MKIVEQFQLKTLIFTAVKNHCILHGHVFVIRSGIFITITNAIYFDIPRLKNGNFQMKNVSYIFICCMKY